MGWLSWIPTKGGGQLTSSVLVSPSLPFCIKNMSQPTASRSAISAVHQWLERMEEENQIWDRKIAEEAFDASQFLRDCISYRKRSSKHIAVKKRLWWCCRIFSLSHPQVVSFLVRICLMAIWREVVYCWSLIFWRFVWLSCRNLSRWFSCSPLLQCCGKATRAWSSEISLLSVLVGSSIQCMHSLWTIFTHSAFTHCCIDG